MKLHELSIQQAQELLSSREISSEELTRAYLERIRRLDPQIKSFLTVPEEIALQQAREADQRIKTGESLTPLAGIPYSAKDSISTRGVSPRCTKASMTCCRPVEPRSKTIRGWS